jgi:hypothetical protein
MSQTTLEKVGKFQVSVERVVNLGNYESLRVGLAEVLDLATEKPDEAYARVLGKVDGWTKQLKPTKVTGPVETGIVKTSEVVISVITAEDPYLTLPWKQSMKKQNLGTIMVTPQALENPLIRQLYDQVKQVKSMHVLSNSYRYSKMPDGAEFLQKWGSSKIG